MPTTNVQHSADFSGQNFYCGIDVHKRSWTVTIRSLGLQVGYFTQPPCAEDLAQHLRSRFPGGNFYSVYEAGYFGTGPHERLCSLGIHNLIVNPADIPATDKQRKTKTDLHDSRALAEYLEKDELKGIYIMERSQQELRSLFRLRLCKSKDLTQAINRLKGFLSYFGIPLPGNWDRFAYLSREALRALSNLELSSQAGTLCLQEHLRDVLERRRCLLETTRQLRTLVQEKFAGSYRCLVSIPGIGPITAVALLAEVGDFSRFRTPRQFASFLGLMPWENSSGESTSTKGIQPRCNHYLRPLLIEAGWSALRRSPELLLYYRRHALRNSKKAIVKVAHKLALSARAVVLHQQPYDPAHRHWSVTTN